jgi:hypothetical protein
VLVFLIVVPECSDVEARQLGTADQLKVARLLAVVVHNDQASAVEFLSP